MATPFDPDAYLAATGGPSPDPTGSAFDPDAYLQATQEKPGYLESFARGVAQGGTLGFADEITGAVESAFTDKTYEQARDESRANYAAARAANPVTSTVGEIAGGVGTAFVGGAPATLGRVAARGALEGAAYGLGSSDSESVADMARDAAVGAATGAAGGAAGHAIGKGVQSAQKALIPAAREFAEERAVKAAGLIQKDLNKLQSGTANDLGRELLDRDLIKPGRTAEELLPGFRAAEEQVGEELGQVMAKADAVNGGSGPQVRSQVAARKLDDANLRADEVMSEGMARDAFETRVANAVGKRETAITTEANRLLTSVDDLEAKAAQAAAARESAITTEAARLMANREENMQLAAMKGWDKKQELARDIATRQQPVLTPSAATPETLAALNPKERRALIEEYVLGKAGGNRTTQVKRATQLAEAAQPALSPSLASPESLAALPAKERKTLVETYVSDLKRERMAPADPRSFTKGLGFDLHTFVDRIEREVLPELNDPAKMPFMKEVKRMAKAYRAKALEGTSFEEARKFKTAIQDTINNFVDVAASKKPKVAMQGILDDEIEKGVGRSLGPEELASYQDKKKSYGRLKAAVAGAEGAERRELGNRFTSPSDYGVGLTAGLATGQPAAGMVVSGATSLLHKTIRERGSSAMAVGADRLADALQRNPVKLGRFAPILAAAAARGQQALAVSDYVLQSQSPEYREMRRGLEQDE